MAKIDQFEQCGVFSIVDFYLNQMFVDFNKLNSSACCINQVYSGFDIFRFSKNVITITLNGEKCKFKILGSTRDSRTHLSKIP